MTQKNSNRISRRSFLQNNVLGVSALAAGSSGGCDAPEGTRLPCLPEQTSFEPETLDLSPARWLWYPSGRVLPNTFVLFRKEIDLPSRPVKARGWIIGESRYLLTVNGQRIQWGPAPCDPRWVEADPLDLTDVLVKGRNVLGATVLYYGHGDGTWPIGKPGFILKLEVELKDGRTETIVSNGSWESHLARSWQPGHYKRWFLRALQE